MLDHDVETLKDAICAIVDAADWKPAHPFTVTRLKHVIVDKGYAPQHIVDDDDAAARIEAVLAEIISSDDHDGNAPRIAFVDTIAGNRRWRFC